tara:strand:- start:13041 stop:14000 length:960 start_codon:yes stop_codon:yes gene_type:complete
MISYINLSDNLNYLTYFQLIKGGNNLSGYRFEPIYFFLNYIFSFFSNYSFLRAFLIGTSLSIKFFLIRAFGKNIPLILLMYFSLQFYPDSYLLRLTLAISLFLISSYKRYKGENLYSFIFLILAINSHRSAFALVPFVILQNLYLPISSLILSLFSIIFVFSFTNFFPLIVSNLNEIITPIIRIAGISSSGNIDYYIQLFNGLSERSSFLTGSYITYLLIFIIYKLIFRNIDQKEKREETNYISNAMLYGLIFLLGFRFGIIDRIARYNYVFFAIALGQIVEMIDKKYKYYIVIIISFILLYLAFSLNQGPFSQFDNFL